ncbi:MAG: DUF4167 domain-containing protein [Sphingomonadales bacterium]|nr:DUF4167 domain-containing protein [Sphingomonadales bacterium]
MAQQSSPFSPLRRRAGWTAPQQNGGREQGNRSDNRAVGNAPTSREVQEPGPGDAQLAGDRVMTEYCPQFADHYFRVVAETARPLRRKPDSQRDDEPACGTI